MGSIVKLLQRESRTGAALPRSISIKHEKQKLVKRIEAGRYTAVKRIDVYENVPPEFIDSLKRRSALKEVLFAEDILIVVSVSGLARAYHAHSTRLLCNLNPTPTHIVHTVVHNKFNRTAIIAFEPHPGVLQCKVIELQALAYGEIRPSKTAWEFELVVLHHPAFFEFDETNGRIGAANLSLELYTFWDMRTYTRVFEIGDEEFQEIRVSDGLVAMFKLPVSDGLPVSLFDIHNGNRLITDLFIETYPNRAVNLLELCREHLLIKQEETLLHVHDLLRDKSSSVKSSRKFSPSCFIFLNDGSENIRSQSYIHEEAKHFLTVSDNVLEFWELSNCKINFCRRIDLPGVDSPSHVSYSLEANLLALYTGGASCSRMHNNAFRDDSPAENLFTSAREFFNYGTKLQLHEDLQTQEAPCSPVRSYATVSSKSTMKPPSGIFLFDLLDFEVLGDIPTSECGGNVSVLQCAADNHALAAGCADGILRIIRIPTMYDGISGGESLDTYTSECRLAPFSSLTRLVHSMRSPYSSSESGLPTTCRETISPRSLLRSLYTHFDNPERAIEPKDHIHRGCKRARDPPNDPEEPNEKNGRSD